MFFVGNKGWRYQILGVFPFFQTTGPVQNGFHDESTVAKRVCAALPSVDQNSTNQQHPLAFVLANQRLSNGPAPPSLGDQSAHSQAERVYENTWLAAYNKVTNNTRQCLFLLASPFFVFWHRAKRFDHKQIAPWCLCESWSRAAMRLSN